MNGSPLVDTTDAPIAGRARPQPELQERYRDALRMYAAAMERAEDPLLIRDLLYRQTIANNDLRRHQGPRTGASSPQARRPTCCRPVVELELAAEASLKRRRNTRRITRLGALKQTAPSMAGRAREPGSC